MLARAVGVLLRPRQTMTEVVRRPSWLALWLMVLAVWAACGGWLLSTPVGRQAIVDEQVRVLEAFGGTVGDARYAALQEHPPWTIYLLSGGRLLLAPPATLLVAMGVVVTARALHSPSSWAQALAITVHASVALAVGQVIATPLHYFRQSLTTPLTVAAVMPFVEPGTLLARVLGSMDVFTIWWAWLMAVGVSVLVGRPTRAIFLRLVLLYGTIAAIVSAAQIISGGN